MSDDITTRVAVLEERHESLKEHFDSRLEGLEHGQAAILAEMTRYKGFLGGIAFLVSGVASLLYLVRDWLAVHIR